MDASSITLILDNTQGWLDAAYAAAEGVMSRAGVLYAMSDDTAEPTRPLGALVGEAVKDMIAEWAGDEYALYDDREKTMTSAIFYTSLGHIDWAAVGKHYYIKTYERSREMGSGR